MKRPIINELQREGWDISPTRGGHLRATHRVASGPMFLSSTPSDWRSDLNTRSLARRLTNNQNDRSLEGRIR